MSLKGINKVAKILSAMQSTRQELLRTGSKTGKVNKQDIRLAQLLEEGKDAMVKKFVKETIKVEK